ncbi:hypothetical protein PoMZ_03204 [Pyricularia oryzae]|uniref:Uncharacterized protein n=1 Tax=Pyricularia oryzae TaxID=318829 RepID=A0A4P7N735_PYROR|nr:hypothetical protein PoMZ_03204 [Pyricularia oryzae]
MFLSEKSHAMLFTSPSAIPDGATGKENLIQYCVAG